jgi:DNA-binding CsgD family transcriptional regulator
MFPQKSQVSAAADPKTYPLGENGEHSDHAQLLALVALSHSPVEQRLYAEMLVAVAADDKTAEGFTVRRLMVLTGIRSLSTIRRALDGLLSKWSVERVERMYGTGGKNGVREPGASYRVFPPAEVIARRNERGYSSFTHGIGSPELNFSFDRAIRKVVENPNLSRREAQVALCCVEGLTNAEIGNRLQVTEQTVKFHLRHVFIKFGVKRRAELISRLLM